MADLLTLNTHAGRNRLFFLLLLGGLYLPSFFLNSFFISIFIIHSFFTKNFQAHFTKFLRPLLFLFIGYFLWCAVSLVYTQNIPVGISHLQTKLGFLLLPIGIIGSGIHTSARYRQLVMNVFVGLSVIVAIAALINAGITSIEAGSLYKVANDDGTIVKQYYFTYTHLAFFIMHPAYFSLYIGAAIFTGLYLVVNKTSLIKSAWLQIVIIGFLFIFLILLQGRISILAFLAMLFIGVLIYFFTKGSYLKGAGIVAVPIGFIVALLLFAPASFTRRFTEFSSMKYDLQAPAVHDFNGFTIRLAEWECALDAIGKQPLLGHGLGDGHIELMKAYRENGFVVGYTKEYNCHNQYLETTLQTGLIGLLIMLGILLYMLYVAYQHKSLLLFVLVGFVSVSMLTESLLERQWGIGFFTSFMVFLAVSLRAELPSSPET